MDDQDYDALLSIVKRELASIERPDLADDANYERRSSRGERLLLEPSARTVEMLSAFERMLAAQDGSVYAQSMSLIRENVKNPPSNATVALARMEGEVGEEVDLGQAPALRELRIRLKLLIRDLGEDAGYFPPVGRG